MAHVKEKPVRVRETQTQTPPPTTTNEHSSNDDQGGGENSSYILIVLIFIATVACLGYFLLKSQGTEVSAPVPTASIQPKVIAEGSKYRVVVDSAGWEELVKELKKVFDKENKGIFTLIEKAKTTLLTLEEATRLAMWLRSQLDFLPRTLRQLYAELSGGKIGKILQLLDVIGKYKSRNEGIYKFRFCFQDTWSYDHYQGDEGSPLEYLTSVKIQPIDTKPITLNLIDLKMVDQLDCGDAVLFFSAPDKKWYFMWEDAQNLPPNSLLKFLLEELVADIIIPPLNGIYFFTRGLGRFFKFKNIENVLVLCINTKDIKIIN